MDNDTVTLPITSFQSTLQHILYIAASSGTTSGSSHATRSQPLHLAPHSRQQTTSPGLGNRCLRMRFFTFGNRKKVTWGQVGTIGWMSHLISPASFPETQLLHWPCGKRHCHGGGEFLAVLSLAASPEFFRILGGAKLLYTILL